MIVYLYKNIGGIFMTDTELLQALSSIIDTKLAPVQNCLESLTQDIDSVKKTSNHLKKDMIRMQAMDEAILDEVERVHDILDKHVKDLAKHSA